MARAALLALAVACACTCAPSPDLRKGEGPATSSAERRYLTDPAYRRAELEASLVNRANGYAKRRLARYGRGWEALPVVNPETSPLREGDHEGELHAAPLAISADASRGDREALRALGEEAFFRYPAQLAGYLAYATDSRERAAQYGLWTNEGRVGGLVRVALPDGAVALGFTCATCHAAVGADGRLVIGAGNPRLDLGRMIVDSARAQGLAANERLLAWGPGRADVSTNEGIDPVRFPDLRPIRGLTHLQHDATVEQRGIVSLAIRIETLLVTGHGETLRPPREIALGLAEYLWSLAGSLPSVEPRTPGAQKGRAIFDARCAGCHAPPFLTGPPITLDAAGTDPRTGRSPDRGTGMYRVPSLRGVGTREALLHDGTAKAVDMLLDPERTKASYAGGHPVRGHDFGLDLDAAARGDLAAYLHSL